MKMPGLIIIGRAERITFPELTTGSVPARVDTGAKTSSVWATQIKEVDGKLSFVLFGKASPFYTGQKITTGQFERRMISTSTGQMQERYVVKLLVSMKGRQIRASFSLANRATQVYPILVGRNVLRGKFMVDVKQGKPLITREKARSKELQSRKKAE